MGGRGQSQMVWEQILELQRTPGVKIVDKNFCQNGYAVCKTQNLEHAWAIYDWLGTSGVYLGRIGGVVEETHVRFQFLCPFHCLFHVIFFSNFFVHVISCLRQ
jgi:hypothetical protein